MTVTLERRYVPSAARKITLRERADGALPLITGYASVFYRAGVPGTEYVMWERDKYGPRIVERIMPTAFDKAIKDDDVRGLYNHDSAIVLGRSTAGTLRLSVDAVGLRYEIDPPETQAARDLISSLRRGDITGSSFAFVPRENVFRSVRSEDGQEVIEEIIERHDVQLFDVGPVTYPAYPGSTAGVRSSDTARAELMGEIGRCRSRIADDLDLWLQIVEIGNSE